MEDINVNISVLDCCSNKCNSNSMMTTKIFTSTNDFISLFCGYYLKVISVENSVVLISIDNSNVFVIRRCYIDIPLKICLSGNGINHEVTIKVNSIT